MNHKWVRVAGYVLNGLIGAFVLFAGSMKVFVDIPGMAEQMAAKGLAGRTLLLGVGEMIAGVLLLLPWTARLGVLVMSGFWGGVIAFNMSHGEDFILPSVFLALTWVGGWLSGSARLR